MDINKIDNAQSQRVVKSMSDGFNKFELIEFDELKGALSTDMATKLFFAKSAGLKLKMIKVSLLNSSIKTEAGALYYYLGKIESEAKMGGAVGILKKAIGGAITDESMAKPTYRGTGEVYLEPSFKHYIFVELNGSIIVDKGMFFCCSDGIETKAIAQNNISSALLGGEGMFQIELSGKGIVILESTVPESEIVKYSIKQGETLKVDGNFVIARTKGVNFTVTKSANSLFGSAINGEGLLNTFTGEGDVWLAPTSPIYRKMLMGNLPMNNQNMNNKQVPTR